MKMIRIEHRLDVLQQAELNAHLNDLRAKLDKFDTTVDKALSRAHTYSLVVIGVGCLGAGYIIGKSRN